MSRWGVKDLALVMMVVLCGVTANNSYLTTYEGREARLVCSWSALGDRDLISGVQWFKGAKRLRSTNRIKFERSGLNFTLVIKEARAGDSARYRCAPKTVGKVDRVQDGAVVLTVREPQVPKPPATRNVSLYSGSYGVLRCNFSAAVQAYNLRMFWSRNGNRLQPAGDGMLKVNNKYNTRLKAFNEDGVDVLNITRVQSGIDGKYACVYKYPSGKSFSMNFNVSVIVPKTRDLVRNLTWSETNSQGSLLCNLTAINREIVKFHWEKDGKELKNNNKYLISETGSENKVKRITIKDLEIKDEGAYRCVASFGDYVAALRFNIKIEKDMKSVHFSPWTPFSVCDNQNMKHRFRTCIDEEVCLTKYGNTYEYDREKC